MKHMKKNGVVPTINVLIMLNSVYQIKIMLDMNFKKKCIKNVFLTHMKPILIVVKKRFKIVKIRIFHVPIEQN